MNSNSSTAEQQQQQQQEQEEIVRFGQTFGYAVTNNNTDSTVVVSSLSSLKQTITINDLSNIGQEHYTNLLQWKEIHSKYLMTASSIVATNNNSNTSSNSSRDIYNEMDRIEWENAFIYAMKYHNQNHSTTTTTNEDIPTVHRIIMAPSSSSVSVSLSNQEQQQQCMMTTTTNTTTTISMKDQQQQEQQQQQYRIIYTLPAGVNVSSNQYSKQEQMDMYTTAVSIYLYRTLFLSNHHNNHNHIHPKQIIILVDVRRGGNDWYNIPAIQFLSFIRHISTILPYRFPNICMKLIIYPIPSIAYHVYQYCIAPILDSNIRNMIVLYSVNTINSSSSNNNSNNNNHKKDGLYQYLVHDDIIYLEELRQEAIKS